MGTVCCGICRNRRSRRGRLQLQYRDRPSPGPSRKREGRMSVDPVIIVGGGPAGMVAGLLLARAGVAVTVLEKHKDFLRDFRGDTVHPSTLELFHEIGRASCRERVCQYV